MVLLAGQSPSDQSREALASLCRAYWFPLYAYLRRRGESPHDAQDLTQGFLLHILENHALSRVHPERGKFRSFLLGSLQFFLADERDKQRAQKRGGGATLISLNAIEAEKAYAAEPVDMLDPSKVFERRWATTLLECALARLDAEFGEPEKKKRFQELQVFLLGDPGPVTYAAAGKKLGLREGAVKVAVLRLRQRFRELLRAEIASTVAKDEDVEEEMKHLFQTLCS